MLARLRKAQENNEGGFTLIELLVVMIIIGILAAIAIPAFLNQKNKAKETSAKADVTTIGKEIAAYYVDGTEQLNLVGGTGEWILRTGATVGSGNEVAKGKLSTGNVASGVTTNDANYCVQVVNGTTSPWKFVATSGTGQSGLLKGACAP